MEFAEACSEVDYILENLNPIDKKKIPESVLNFFKNNKSMFYKVNLTVNESLENQNLRKETKAFLQILNYKYFADENQKEEFKEVFRDTEIQEIMQENNIDNFETKERETTRELTIYKENKIIMLLKKILHIFKK